MEVLRKFFSVCALAILFKITEVATADYCE